MSQAARQLPPPDDGAKRLALLRRRVVIAWRDWCKRSGTAKTVATRDFLHAYHAGLVDAEALTALQEIRAWQTLYNWDRALRDSGDDYQALCDRRGRRDQDTSLDDELQFLVLQAWLQPNQPSVSLAYRVAGKAAEARGLSLPHERTVRRFLDDFRSRHADLVMLRRRGEKALKDTVGPYIARNDQILEVGDCIFADGHRLNFDAIHPFTGRPARLTLVLWFDWASRMPVGWEILPEENTVAISSALRMAIQALGQIPRVAYIDNGRAFKARYFTCPTDMDGLYARLGVHVQHSKPYEARTKIVERFFGTFNEQCARLMPSYRGNSIGDKPARLMRNEKYHQARHDDYVPTIRDVAEVFARYVDWYAHQPHDGLGGKTPAEVFQAGRGEGFCPEQLADLERQFLFSKRIEKPSRTGFQLAGVRYESDALYGWSAPIVVKYSWTDMSRVLLFDERGNELGEARPQILVHPLAKLFGDELDLLTLQEANKRQKDLKKRTLQLARDLDREADCDLYEALPHVAAVAQARRKPELTILKPEPKPAVPDQQEIERLEALQRAKVAEIAARPRYQAPEFFASRLERYEFLFQTAVVQNLELYPDDAAFMASYEASDEYRDSTGRRYEQLRRTYAQLNARGL